MTHIKFSPHNNGTQRRCIHLKKQFAIILSMVMIICMFSPITASAAQWKTGNYNGTVKVYLTNTNKDGYVTIHGYTCTKDENHSGKCSWSKELSTGTRVRIDYYDGKSGKYITSYTCKCGTKIKLGKDHSSYKLKITKLGSSNGKTANNWFLVHWGVETKSNTHF